MRKLVIIAFVSLLVSCGDDAVGPDRMAPGNGSAEISDATQGLDHNPGFWWLAPMVPQPDVNGTFQSLLSPTIIIEDCALTTVNCDDEVAQPLVSSVTAGLSAEFTRQNGGLIVEADHFKVEFDTEAFGLKTANTYRIVAFTDPLTEFGGPFIMGFADFQVAESGKEAKNLETGEMIALVDGRTLPIKFFVNEEAYPHELKTNQATGGDHTDPLCQINCSVTVIPAGQDTTEASLFDETGFELTAVQFPDVDVARVLIIDERNAADDTSCAPGVESKEKKNCFRYEIAPNHPLPSPFRFGVCPVGITFGDGIWQLSKVDYDAQGNPTVTVHGDVKVDDFLPCTGETGSQVTFLQPLLDFFVGPLYAEDTRVWGGTDDDFSDILWEVPAEMSATGPSGTVQPGTSETVTVLVLSKHALAHSPPANIPLSGVSVTFQLTGGTLSRGATTGVTSITDTTDVNGEIAVAWTFPTGDGTLEITSPDADGDPISFAVTGAEPDLIVSAMTVTPATPTSADLIDFTATVTNVGSGPAGASTLMFKIGGETPGLSQTLFSVPLLQPGETYTAARQEKLKQQSYRNTATADYNVEVPESNEDNNTSTTDFQVMAALYAVNSGDDGLSSIDPGTGVASFIARLSTNTNEFVTPIAMAVRPSDQAIFVWNNSDLNADGNIVRTGDLLRVDACGTTAQVNTDNSLVSLASLAVDGNGAMFGGDTKLYSIDPATGTPTEIGSVLDGNGTSYRLTGLDVGPDGTLWGLSINLDLLKIDKTTGGAEVIAQLAVSGLGQALAFDPSGQLIGSNGSALFDIDTSNGAVSNVRTVSDSRGPQGMDFSGQACRQ